MPNEMTAPLSRHQAAAHEFVNSLSSVRSLVELLVAYPALEAGDRRRFIGIIHDQTERLLHLMGRLHPNDDKPSTP
ncbi:MAG TPA: hypothetical protein VLT88_13715 [Desulfosarcina sp.]|nr:hypothetical protein [Desulfosarcina sp.]